MISRLLAVGLWAFVLGGIIHADGQTYCEVEKVQDGWQTFEMSFWLTVIMLTGYFAGKELP